MARAAFIQAQVQAGKVDVFGREAGLSNSAMGILATPSPMPGTVLFPYIFNSLSESML